MHYFLEEPHQAHHDAEIIYGGDDCVLKKTFQWQEGKHIFLPLLCQSSSSAPHQAEIKQRAAQPLTRRGEANAAPDSNRAGPPPPLPSPGRPAPAPAPRRACAQRSPSARRSGRRSVTSLGNGGARGESTRRVPAVTVTAVTVLTALTVTAAGAGLGAPVVRRAQALRERLAPRRGRVCSVCLLPGRFPKSRRIMPRIPPRFFFKYCQCNLNSSDLTP